MLIMIVSSFSFDEMKTILDLLRHTTVTSPLTSLVVWPPMVTLITTGVSMVMFTLRNDRSSLHVLGAMSTLWAMTRIVWGGSQSHQSFRTYHRSYR